MIDDNTWKETFLYFRCLHRFLIFLEMHLKNNNIGFSHPFFFFLFLSLFFFLFYYSISLLIAFFLISNVQYEGFSWSRGNARARWLGSPWFKSQQIINFWLFFLFAKLEAVLTVLRQRELGSQGEKEVIGWKDLFSIYTLYTCTMCESKETNNKRPVN